MKIESVYTTLIASRGWHVYQKTTWKSPKKGEALECKRETDPVALRFDPYSIAFTRRSIEFLTPLTVGHMPLEISRFVWFFLERGGDFFHVILGNKIFKTQKLTFLSC